MSDDSDDYDDEEKWLKYINSLQDYLQKEPAWQVLIDSGELELMTSDQRAQIAIYEFEEVMWGFSQRPHARSVMTKSTSF